MKEKKEYPGGRKAEIRDARIWGNTWDRGRSKSSIAQYGRFDLRNYMGGGLPPVPEHYKDSTSNLKYQIHYDAGQYAILSGIYRAKGREEDAERCMQMAKDLLKRKGRKRTKMDDYADRLSLRGRHTEDRPNYSETDIEGLAIGAIEWLKAMKKERRSLGTFVIASIVGILGGIFFLSSNITGNAIADMTTKTTSFLGAGLLIVGLVAGFFWLKGRKPKHKK